MWEMEPLPWSGYRLLALRDPSQVQLHCVLLLHICTTFKISSSRICAGMQLVCACLC